MRFRDMTEEEVLRIVGPMMDNFLEGSNEVNHAKHVRHFSDRLKNVVTPGNLKSAGQTAKSPLPDF